MIDVIAALKLRGGTQPKREPNTPLEGRTEPKELELFDQPDQNRTEFSGCKNRSEYKLSTWQHTQ